MTPYDRRLSLASSVSSDPTADPDDGGDSDNLLPLHERVEDLDAKKPAAAIPVVAAVEEEDEPDASAPSAEDGSSEPAAAATTAEDENSPAASAAPQSREDDDCSSDGGSLSSPSPPPRRIRFLGDDDRDDDGGSTRSGGVDEEKSDSESSLEDGRPRPGEFAVPTLGRWELTDDEKAATWYSNPEFLQIKMDIVNEASALAAMEEQRRGSDDSKGGGRKSRGGRRGSVTMKFLKRTRRSSSHWKATTWDRNSEHSRRRDDSSSSAGDDDPAERMCPRGLEMIHPSSLLAQRRSRTAAVFAVLKEQAAQRREGSSDPWGISYSSLRLSRPKVDEAVERGRGDEVDAREIFDEDDNHDHDGSGVSGGGDRRSSARFDESDYPNGGEEDEKRAAASQPRLFKAPSFRRKGTLQGQRQSSFPMLGKQLPEDDAATGVGEKVECINEYDSGDIAGSDEHNGDANEGEGKEPRPPNPKSPPTAADRKKSGKQQRRRNSFLALLGRNS